jgi:hypothetical protein
MCLTLTLFTSQGIPTTSLKGTAPLPNEIRFEEGAVVAGYPSGDLMFSNLTEFCFNFGLDRDRVAKEVLDHGAFPKTFLQEKDS